MTAGDRHGVESCALPRPAGVLPLLAIASARYRSSKEPIWRARPDHGPVVLARDYVPLLMGDTGRARSSRDDGFGPLAPDRVRPVLAGLGPSLSALL